MMPNLTGFRILPPRPIMYGVSAPMMWLAPMCESGDADPPAGAPVRSYSRPTWDTRSADQSGPVGLRPSADIFDPSRDERRRMYLVAAYPSIS